MAIRILDCEGWRDVKIKTVGDLLGVTKGSFYHWFKSKRDFEWQDYLTVVVKIISVNRSERHQIQ